MKRKNFVVGVILGLAILSFAWFWSFLSSVNTALGDSPSVESAEYYQPAPTPGSDLDAIEGDAEIKIPSSAKEIHATISGFRDLDTWVRFNLPANELPFFIEGTQCKSPLVSVNPENFKRDELFDPEWWQPHQAKDLVVCNGGHQFLRQQILVDRSNNETLTVYVFSVTNDFGTPTPNSQ